MNVFFDVDGTLCSMNDGVLRPGAPQLLHDLAAAGHRVYVWSGVGVRWPDLRRWGVDGFVVDCFRKPIFDYRAQATRLGVLIAPDFVIDDHPGVVEAFGGYLIAASYYHDERDRELDGVRAALALAADEAPRFSAVSVPPTRENTA